MIEGAQARAMGACSPLLDALPSSAAIVDASGTILAVNSVWREYGLAGSLACANSGVGLNYLEVCERSASDAPEARAVSIGLRQVLSGPPGETFTLDYPCHGPDRPRWFTLRIAALEDAGGRRALLTHSDTTEVKLACLRLARLSRLYTVLSKTCEVIVSTELPVELYEATCRILVEHGLLKMALVAQRAPETGRVVVVSSHGESGDYLSQLVLTTDDSPNSRGTVGTALASGRHDVSNDFAGDDRMAPWREAALAQGYAATASFPLNDGDGETFGCLTLFAGERDYFQDDEISLMLAVAGDLAFAVQSRLKERAKRRAELALRESEERYRATASQLARLLDSSLDVICAFDSEGRFVQVSLACESVWGHTVEELLGTAYIDKVLPEDRLRTIAKAASIMQGQAARAFENRYRRKDGQVTHIQWTANWSESEQIMFCVARDISDIKRNLERIAEQAALLDKAQDAILVRDLTHHIRYWNQSAERLYGWKAEEVLGRPAPEVLYRDTASFHAAQSELLSKGEWVGELEHFTKDGRALTVEGHLTLVLDDMGNPKSVLSISTDITRRKQLEQQFFRAQRMEGLGTLAGGIAHDLNNVLSPIMMAVELLKYDEVDPERLETLELMESSAKRGAEMVRQVLSFARGMQGRRVAVRTGELLDDVAKIIRDTFPKNLEIVVLAKGDLWPLHADPTQLHQVLVNLCVNARDATPLGGRITLSAENAQVDEHFAAMILETRVGPYLKIEVEDTGSGIEEAVLEQIFDPFFTTKELGQGTGLGLSTTLAIVKGHGGFIRVASEPGVGSKFSIYLPADRDGPAPQEPVPAVELPRGRGQTILVIDDEPTIRTISKQTLEMFGYRVLLACDGPEAISVYVQHQEEIAVVVTDMMMPLMDGPATTRVLKRLNPDVRVIAASGINTSAMAGQATEAGMELLLAKPYTAETLLQALHQILG